MTRINELKQQIATIESQVKPGMSKEDMYDLLVVAYNHHKDILALQQQDLPLKPTKDLAIALSNTEEKLANAIAENGRLTDTIDARDNELFKLNTWKDGANLEGEVLRDEVQSLSNKVSTLKESNQVLEDKLSQIANLAK